MKLAVAFFQAKSGAEPVRVWLRAQDVPLRKAIGEDIKTIQFGWPLGMPLVRKMSQGLWEVRTCADKRIARVLFTVIKNKMVLLHGFIKKDKKTPAPDLRLAIDRKKKVGGLR